MHPYSVGTSTEASWCCSGCPPLTLENGERTPSWVMYSFTISGDRFCGNPKSMISVGTPSHGGNAQATVCCRARGHRGIYNLGMQLPHDTQTEDTSCHKAAVNYRPRARI